MAKKTKKTSARRADGDVEKKEPVTPSTACPFLDKLPAELRNRIYELVFPLRDVNGNNKWVVIRRTTRRDRPSVLSILQTCRKIHQESKDMFFAINTYLQFSSSADFVTFASGSRTRHLQHTQRLRITGARDDDHLRIVKGKKYYKPWWEKVQKVPNLQMLSVDLAQWKFIRQLVDTKHRANASLDNIPRSVYMEYQVDHKLIRGSENRTIDERILMILLDYVYYWRGFSSP